MKNINETSFSVQEEKEIIDQYYLETLESVIKGSYVIICINILISIFLFVFYYHKLNLNVLISWFIILNISSISSVFLNITYQQYKQKSKIKEWEKLQSVPIILSAALWGVSVFFLYNNITENINIILFSFLTAAYTLGTIGSFKLFRICVNLILLPFIFLYFLQNSFSHVISGIFLSLYLALLFIINYRSSEYINKTILLNIKNKYFAHQANHDYLSNLPNQRLLIQLLKSSVMNAKQNNQSFALICFSINRIETFNTSLGYQGDLIVQTIARSLSSQFESQWSNNKSKHRILALPRSDIFAMIIHPIDEKEIQHEVDNIFSELERLFHLEAQGKISVSMGVSLYPKDATDARTLLNNAYSVLFKAKLNPGNQVEYFKAQTQKENTSFLLDLENDLKKAIKNNEFELHYQPIIDLQNGRVAGVEALIRWMHPTLGLVSPADFIPLAEKSSLIVDIGEWVLEKSALQTLFWHHQGFNTLSLKVGVNLSVQQLRKGNLLDIIDNTLRKTGLSPHYLDLEITEASLLDENIAPLIQEISKKGITLSLDDFGTGYSGLNYLKNFNIDTIKIDKSLIHNITKNDKTGTIVSAILVMAKELGIKTLAEGVETLEQVDFLQIRHCQYVQGYYFCKPLNVDKFTRLLEKHLALFENKNSFLQGKA